MKRLSAIVAIILALGCCIASAAPKGELSYGAQTRLEVTYDKFTGWTTIVPRRDVLETSYNRPRLILAASHDGKVKELYLCMIYTSDRWSFLEYGIILIDGARYETPKMSFFDDLVVRDVLDGGISERFFIPSTDASAAAIIDAVAKAKLVEYRFYGDRDATGSMSASELQAWREMLEYYDYIDLPERR